MWITFTTKSHKGLIDYACVAFVHYLKVYGSWQDHCFTRTNGYITHFLTLDRHYKQKFLNHINLQLFQINVYFINKSVMNLMRIMTQNETQLEFIYITSFLPHNTNTCGRLSMYITMLAKTEKIFKCDVYFLAQH